VHRGLAIPCRRELYETGVSSGSRHRTRAITLNTTLVRFPVAALEYVIVHELAHLRHADHGRGFWSLVAAALPDHGERRKLLSTYTP